MTLKRRILILLMMLSLGGCYDYKVLPQMPNDPQYAPTLPKQASIAPNNTGSLYQTDFGLDSLYVDLRAYKIGDILTVALEETTTASKKAGTSASKKSSVNIEEPTLFSKTTKVPNVLPSIGVKQDAAFDLQSNNTFAGDGSSSQNNNLMGSITVTVSNVLANGNLVIQGEKWITLNQGSEYILLTGIVRPYDIDDNNTVKSRKLANPRITYSGRGALAEANQQGWLARFFNGPAFPY